VADPLAVSTCHGDIVGVKDGDKFHNSAIQVCFGFQYKFTPVYIPECEIGVNRETVLQSKQSDCGHSGFNQRPVHFRVGLACLGIDALIVQQTDQADNTPYEKTGNEIFGLMEDVI